MTWQTDTQANILRGLQATHARYLFLRFDNGDHLKAFVRDALHQVRDAAWQRDRFPPHDRDLDEAVLNLAFTWYALDLIGRPYQSDELRRAQPPRSDAFAHRDLQPAAKTPGAPWLDHAAQNSMYRRLDLLGEAPIVDADGTTLHHSWTWDTDQRIDVLAWYSGPSWFAISAAWNDIAPAAGLTIVRELWAKARPGWIDWFGFPDAVSQPAVDGFHTRSEMFGRGAWTRQGWRGLRPGEFVVGDLDEGGERRRPDPGGILHHSTFLVFRQIEMYPERFEALLSHYEQEVGVPGDELASWLVGRHRVGNGNPGTSLMVDGPSDERDFIYGMDPEGLRCPLGAHMRRANPRDSMGKDGVRANRHRIIRRGMTYRDGTRRGLAFIALQARIEDQFEFVQAHWLNTGPTLHAGTDPDPIAGNADPGLPAPLFVRQGNPPLVVGLERPDPFGQPLTTVRGGEYFVLPALPGLADLADR